MKIAIISGASSGIGASIAKELDKFKLDELWLIGRNSEKLSLIKDMLSTKSKVFVLDLTEISAYSVIESAILEHNCQIEYLVCSAGVGYNGAFEHLTLDKINSTISTNCTSLTILIRTCLPYLHKNGKIINIASGAGFLPQPNFAVYASSKSYVISLSRALRTELKHKKISVTAVCPGPVDTEFFSGLENVKEYKKKYLISPEKVARSAIKASLKNKAVCSPTFSMKLVHLASKVLPTSLMLKFFK